MINDFGGKSHLFKKKIHFKKCFTNRLLTKGLPWLDSISFFYQKTIIFRKKGTTVGVELFGRFTPNNQTFIGNVSICCKSVQNWGSPDEIAKSL
jgi:hypothetical protein